MAMEIGQIIDTDRYPIADAAFVAACRADLDRTGVLVLSGFLTSRAVESVRREGEAHRDKAYYCSQEHTVYLSPRDSAFASDHPRNRLVTSTKGCITDDQVPASSPLRTLYHDPEVRAFLCTVLGERALFEYADPLSSINIHYAETGQELGWHFDNSSFAITLMIQPAEQGGQFEYVSAVRDADCGDMNYDGVGAVLDGRVVTERLMMDAGALVLFRGRNAMHRVTPNEGGRTRMLAVLAYNAEPGISLSEEARMTFYGRVQ